MEPFATIEAQPVTYADVSVAWGARVLQPARWSASSPQNLIVEVSGPIVLDVPVQFSLGTGWERAEWSGESGQTRRAVAPLGRGALRVDPGLYPITVRLTAGTEHPVARAGSLRVTR